MAKRELLMQLTHIQSLLLEMPSSAASQAPAPAPLGSPASGAAFPGFATQQRAPQPEHKPTGTQPWLQDNWQAPDAPGLHVPILSSSPTQEPSDRTDPADALGAATRSAARASAELATSFAAAMAQLPHTATAQHGSGSAAPHLETTAPSAAAAEAQALPRSPTALASHVETPQAICNPLFNTSRSPSPSWGVPPAAQGRSNGTLDSCAQAARPSYTASVPGSVAAGSSAAAPSDYAALISRIKVTEGRLQEAITSLTDATRSFRAGVAPARSPALHAGANAGDADASRTREPTAQDVQHDQRQGASAAPAPPNARVGRESGTFATRLNPSYPASSRSTSPTAPVTTSAAAHSHVHNAVHNERGLQQATFAVPQLAQHDSTSAPSVRGTSLHAEAARLLVEKIQRVSTGSVTGMPPVTPAPSLALPGSPLSAQQQRELAQQLASLLAGSTSGSAIVAQAPQPAQAARPQQGLALLLAGTDERTGTKSAASTSCAGSVASQSSIWTLDPQRGAPGRSASASPQEPPRHSAALPQPHLRDVYAAPAVRGRPARHHSMAPPRPAGTHALAQARAMNRSMPAQVQRGSAASLAQGVQPHAAQPSVQQLEVEGAGQVAAERTWLQDHNEKRVSYYEPTIFMLQQAGIHVEPHWFSTVQCASASVVWCVMRR